MQEKNNLYLIKERRKQISSVKIANHYQISLENLYQVFANHLLLFGDMTIEIIIEIVTCSQLGIEYLKKSEDFKFLITNYPLDQIFLNQNAINFVRSKFK